MYVFSALVFLVSTVCKLLFAPRLEWSGFSPLIAVALFSGLMARDKKDAFFLPLVSLFVSDLAIELLYQAKLFPFAGLYQYQLVNYGLLLVSTLIGRAIKGTNPAQLGIGALLSPTVFFLSSNYLVWASAGQSFYPKTLAGLQTCYMAGIPFYARSVAATVLFLPLLMFGYNKIVEGRKVPSIA